MRDENLKIPILVSLIFLVTSIIGQYILGLLGGFFVYLLSEICNIETNQIDYILMFLISLVGIIWFIKSMSSWTKWTASFFVLFGICNAFLFYSYGRLPEYFYPDRYVFGSLVSAFILSILGFFKTRQEGRVASR